MWKKEYFSNDNNTQNNGDFKDIDIRELRNVNFFSNDLYNGIVYFILFIIIIFFIWLVSSRSFIQDEDMVKTTTPFTI